MVFLDGDYSDYPDEMSIVVNPIILEDYDFVLGSRIIGKHEYGALLPQAIFGNWIASILIRLFWKYQLTQSCTFPGNKVFFTQTTQYERP